MSNTATKALVILGGVIFTCLLTAATVALMGFFPLPDITGWQGAAMAAAGGNPAKGWVLLLAQVFPHMWVLWLVPTVGLFATLYALKLIPSDAMGFYVERVYTLERALSETSAREEKLAAVWQNLNTTLDTLFEKASELWIVTDKEGRLRRWNPGLADFFRPFNPSISVTEGENLASIIPGFINTPLMKALYTAAQGQNWYGEVALAGTETWLLAWVFPLGDDIAIVLSDASYRHKQEASLQNAGALLRHVVEDSQLPTAILDTHFNYIQTSRNWNRTFGIPESTSLLGQSHSTVSPSFPRDMGVVRQQLMSGQTVGRNDERINIAGREETFSWHIRPWRDAFGRPGGYIFTAQNITHQAQLSLKVAEATERENALAYNDMLTGLPNRQLFHDRLNVALAQAYRQLGKVALLFLDLDGFKKVNDNLGHDYGDMLLKQVADRLKTCIRQSDTVARLGGDEFTIILGIRGKEDAEMVAKKLLDVVHAPYNLGGNDVTHVGTSIGVSLYPQDGAQASELIRKADAAMYASKQAGKNTYRFFADLPPSETESH